jgi:hypothetical protein
MNLDLTQDETAVYRGPDPHKEIERLHIRSFRHWCNDFPVGELIECETPDFLVVTATGRKIGIEHTQVFKKGGADQTAEQADEAARRRKAGRSWSA